MSEKQQAQAVIDAMVLQLDVTEEEILAFLRVGKNNQLDKPPKSKTKKGGPSDGGNRE